MSSPPLLELGGSGPPLHLAPANSFPHRTYQPLIERLAKRFRVFAIPLRGLLPDPGPPPSQPVGWGTLGEEVAARIEAEDLHGVVAVGHSFGAVISLVAAARRPARFRALCLLDPTMVLSGHLEQIYRLDANGVRQHRLAELARERRADFGSEQEAFDLWRPKRLFRAWSDESLWAYVHSGLRPRADGPGLTLAWPAAWEAYYYEGLYPDSWQELERLDPALPVLVIRGGASDTFVDEAEVKFRASRPTATIASVPDRGHLFPQEAPELTGRILDDWLATVE